MKGLGLTGVGLGAAAAVAPVFHDLDELMSAPTALWKRPWYVKERELFNPTDEVDWDIMQRYDRRLNAQTQRTQSMYPNLWPRYQEAGANRNAVLAQKSANQEPGFSLKFQALRLGTDTVKTLVRMMEYGFTGIKDPKYWAETPAERGVPKWTGTLEEASRVLQAALTYFGSPFNGFAKLDSTWRNKLLVTHTTGGARKWTYSPSAPLPPESDSLRFDYEDVPKGYAELHKGSDGRDAGRAVIPTKDMYLIVMANAEPREPAKTAPSLIARDLSNATGVGRAHCITKIGLFNFLRALGDYQLLGFAGHQTDFCNNAAAAVLTGISESSRQNLYILTPELGPHIGQFALATDLPLEPTKPIDAGIWRFCHSCTKCADTCPAQSISFDKEPSYEIPPCDGMPSTFHNPGVKAFWNNIMLCRVVSREMGCCNICYGNCSFSEGKAAMIHTVVKGTIATTGLFNGFFANMSDVFGYGNMDPESWWDMSLPAYGMDTTIGVTKGGY